MSTLHDVSPGHTDTSHLGDIVDAYNLATDGYHRANRAWYIALAAVVLAVAACALVLAERQQIQHLNHQFQLFAAAAQQQDAQHRSTEALLARQIKSGQDSLAAVRRSQDARIAALTGQLRSSQATIQELRSRTAGLGTDLSDLAVTTAADYDHLKAQQVAPLQAHVASLDSPQAVTNSSVQQHLVRLDDMQSRLASRGTPAWVKVALGIMFPAALAGIWSPAH